MQTRMASEDGVEATVDHLHRSLYGSLLGGKPLKWMRETSTSSAGQQVSDSGASGSASSAEQVSNSGESSSKVPSTTESEQVGREQMALCIHLFHRAASNANISSS